MHSEKINLHKKQTVITVIVVFVSTIVLGFVFVTQLHHHHVKANKDFLLASLDSYAVQLKNEIERGMRINKLIEEMTLSSNGALWIEFTDIAAGALSTAKAISNISLDPESASNKYYIIDNIDKNGSFEFIFLINDIISTDALSVKESGQQVLIGPFQLERGGSAYILRNPIYSNIDGTTSEFWGFSNVVWRLDNLIDFIGLSHLEELKINYQIFDKSIDQMVDPIISSNGSLLDDHVQVTIEIANKQWVIKASPSSWWVDPMHMMIESIPAILLSLFSGFLAYQVRKTNLLNKSLEHEINQRTCELQIAAIAFQSENGIIVTDANHQIIKVNKAFQQITGYKEYEVIGKTPAILNSGEHDVAFYQDMHTRLSRVGSWQGEIWNRKKSGELYPEHLTITAVCDKAGAVSYYIASLIDLSELKATQEKVVELKYVDSLTKLPNRQQLIENLMEIVCDMEDELQKVRVCGFLLYLDIDNFKQFNDALGQLAGDEILRELGSRLEKTLSSDATLSRVGSDEFAILLQYPGHEESIVAATAERTSENLLSIITEPFELADHSHHITASIGVSLIHPNEDPDEILKQAELAMFKAKTKGRNKIYFYQQSMQLKAIRRLELLSDMYGALATDAFELHYQPQFNSLLKIVGVEALIRWKHPTKGYISPAEFIPLAEETDLILFIGDWVIKTAFQQLAQWSRYKSTSSIIMSVNVSVKQFDQSDFVNKIELALKESGVNPKLVQLELTESMLASDTKSIIDKMLHLKSLGLLISLDDFGTGYSSLSYLQKLPIDQLKIDQSFVADIDTSAPDKDLAATIISLSKNLDLEVIAEGVETNEQLNFLKSKGCDLYQGFLLAKPCQAVIIEELVWETIVR